jgi:hypothetical protein
VRGQPDIDRQHPQLLEHLQDTALGRDRQREDHEIDARGAGEFDEIVDGAELGHARASGRAAVVVAVVEGADDMHVGVALRGERADQRFAVIVAADHHRAAVEAALLGPAPDQKKQPAPECDQRKQAEHIEGAEPGAGELIAGFGEERNADGDQKHHRPGGSEPHILLLVSAEGLHLIDIGDLEGQHRQERDAENGGEVIPGEAVSGHDIHGVNGKADDGDQSRFDQTNESGEHDRRIRMLIGLLGQRAGGGRKLVRLGLPRFSPRHRRHGRMNRGNGLENRVGLGLRHQARFHTRSLPP